MSICPLRTVTCASTFAPLMRPYRSASIANVGISDNMERETEKSACMTDWRKISEATAWSRVGRDC